MNVLSMFFIVKKALGFETLGVGNNWKVCIGNNQCRLLAMWTLEFYFLCKMIIETTWGTVPGVGMDWRMLSLWKSIYLSTKQPWSYRLWMIESCKNWKGKREGEGERKMRRRNSRGKRRGEEKEMNVEEKQREGGVQREPQLSARQHSTSQPVNYHHVQMQAG